MRKAASFRREDDMAVRRDSDGTWRYRKVVKLPDGGRARISGTPSRNTKEAAEQAERAHIDRTLNPRADEKKKEVPTFEDWFHNRFWQEWVIARKNSPSEVEAKKSIYRNHLGPIFGTRCLDEIEDAAIAQFKATLIKKKLSEKTINNVLCVLSKSLHYAAKVKVIGGAPDVGLFKVEPPEIGFYEFEAYARILASARVEGPRLHAAVKLGGDAGLRVGEIREVRFGIDADMVGRTITVNRQVRGGVVGKPKSGKRRTVRMTDSLYEALAALPFEHGGLVVRKGDGLPFCDHELDWTMVRICRRAGLPEAKWHVLRHTFATHAALFGVNPWTLMKWLGHRDIERTTMRYVHLASSHQRELPSVIADAAETQRDPDRRVLAMLSAREHVPFDVEAIALPERRSPRLTSLAEWRRNRVDAGKCRDCGQSRHGGTGQRCQRCATAERERARRGKTVAKQFSSPEENVVLIENVLELKRG
jgi:integrase